jgi:hypothetical protein
MVAVSATGSAGHANNEGLTIFTRANFPVGLNLTRCTTAPPQPSTTTQALMVLCGARARRFNSLWGYNCQMTPLTCDNAGSFSIYTIFEGTSKIQRLIISRAISGVHIR